MGKLRSGVDLMKEAAWRRLRALMPPVTVRMVFRALLGALLFLCGLIVGIWLIIRFRHIQDRRP